MFGSRTVLAAIGTITFGALFVSAQTQADRDRLRECTNSIRVQNPQNTYYWAYDDPSFFNVTYLYDPAACDPTIAPVNSVRLEDYVGGGVYTCTRQQFAPERNTIYSQCRLTQ